MAKPPALYLTTVMIEEAIGAGVPAPVTDVKGVRSAAQKSACFLREELGDLEIHCGLRRARDDLGSVYKRDEEAKAHWRGLG